MGARVTGRTSVRKRHRAAEAALYSSSPSRHRPAPLGRPKFLTACSAVRRAVLADVGIDEDVVVVVSVEVVPVVPDESVVVVLVDSVVVSLSCAQAASVSEAATMATAVRLRSVVFIGVLVCVPWGVNPAGPEGTSRMVRHYFEASLMRASTRERSLRSQ